MIVRILKSSVLYRKSTCGRKEMLIESSLDCISVTILVSIMIVSWSCWWKQLSSSEDLLSHTTLITTISQTWRGPCRFTRNVSYKDFHSQADNVIEKESQRGPHSLKHVIWNHYSGGPQDDDGKIRFNIIIIENIFNISFQIIHLMTIVICHWKIGEWCIIIERGEKRVRFRYVSLTSQKIIYPKYVWYLGKIGDDHTSTRRIENYYIIDFRITK